MRSCNPDLTCSIRCSLPVRSSSPVLIPRMHAGTVVPNPWDPAGRPDTPDTNSGFYEHKWVKHIQAILQDTGRSDVWLTQTVRNANTFKNSILRTLLDQNFQKWNTALENSSKNKTYRLFKCDMRLENYLFEVPKKIFFPIIRFRTTNHKLPVEIGRWSNVPPDERTCTTCSRNCLGDELHYLLDCDYFIPERQHPNILKYHQLMNSHNKTTVKNLSIFVQEIMTEFENDYKAL